MADSNLIWIPKGEFFEGTHYILKEPSLTEENAQSSPINEPELVVCIHGLDSYHYNYDEFSTILVKAGFRVLYYDLIGRGFSKPHRTGLYGLQPHIDQLHSLLQYLQLLTTPCHIIGLSMGGALAALYAAQYSEQIRSLTLMAPAGLMNLPDLLHIQRRYPCLEHVAKLPMQMIGRIQSLSTTFCRKDGVFKQRENFMFHRKLLARDKSPTHAEASWRSIFQFPLFECPLTVSAAEKVASIPALPVHLIFGDSDKVVPYEHNFSRWKGILSAGACRPTFTVMPEAGHVVLMEYPEESCALLLNYLLSLRSS